MDRRLVIRRVRVDDDAQLTDLYDSLDVDARCRRFFGASLPGPPFFTDLATVADRGGARFVAVSLGPCSAAERLVGEAGYVRLPNGDGELAMTVAAGWRGRVEPVLLDALTEAAAAAGVPNLEADVLSVDRSLLELLRSRGAVVMGHDAWRVVRLLVGTGEGGATWPAAHDRRRVLVERPGGRWAGEAEARAAGYDVLTCGGPEAHGDGCPALIGEPCSLAAAADVVIADPAAEGRWADLLAAHAALHPGVELRVEPTPDSTRPIRPGAATGDRASCEAMSFESKEAPR